MQKRSVIARLARLTAKAQSSHVLHQILHFDLQRICDCFHRPQGHVHFAPFNRTDLRPVNAADIGEDVLAPVHLQTYLADFRADGLLNILH